MRGIDLSFVGLGDIDTECKGGSCLPELSVQVGVVFTTKTIIAQFLEIFKPWLKKRRAQIANTLQLGKVQKELSKIAEDAAQLVLPDAVEEWVNVDEATLRRKRAMDQKQAVLEQRLQNAQERDAHREGAGAEIESYLAEYSSTFDDFNEMAIQYGYLALFSPAYPLAPALALLNNILEIRVDATKLCRTMRRPKWETVEDIGSWYTVLTAIGFMAVMVNSTMVAFVGSKHGILGDRGLEDTTDDDAESLLAEEMGGFNARIKNWNLWLFAVGIEHAMLMLRVLVLALFPDDPDWLDDAREVLQFRLDDQKDVEAMEAEKELHAEFLEKLDGYDDANHAPMEHLTTRTLRAHMNAKKADKEEAKKMKTEVATKKTAVKVVNPLQQGFDNPLGGLTDSSDEEEGDEKGMD